MKGRWIRLAAAAGLVLCLTGCALPRLAQDPEELYALPELPERYMDLNRRLAAILDGGAEHAAPSSGSNIQPVQMADLNGDGREEALAFFRHSSEEKPLKIYVFAAQEDTWRQAALIEASGLGIHSVAYSDIDGDGRLEILVGWRVGLELQALSVYTLERDGARELLRSSCVKYSLTDLDGDGKQELTLLRSDEDGIGTADCCLWREGGLAVGASVRLSVTMAELSQQGRITEGTLRTGERALFITGVAEGSRSITDVLVLQGEELRSLTVSPVTGVSAESSRFCGLYPQDIDGDGTTEIPRAVLLGQGAAETERIRRVDWVCFDAAGVAEPVRSTYHALEEGWYLSLPEMWDEQVVAERSTAGEESKTTFYVNQDIPGARQALLRIYALSGTNRERQAARTGRFILSRSGGVIYAGELLAGNGSWAYGVTEDQVRAAFSLITREWFAGDG